MRTVRHHALPTALAPALALAMGLAIVGLAVAGGSATVALTQPPDDVAAGTETTFDLTVMQHGVTPVSWPRLTVVASNAATGESVSGAAVASGPAGHYTVSLTFPSEGSWSLAFESDDLLMQGSSTLAVGAALPPAPAPATSPAADLGPVVALGALVLLFLVAFGALVVHDRRADRGAQPSATSG